ncbi:hypothetical protein B7767_41420 [Streptomyces sp. 13-12-16]|nr:hypothetical protein B7767_41420 [Streptomyces sp. 13-12-16]
MALLRGQRPSRSDRNGASTPRETLQSSSRGLPVMLDSRELSSRARRELESIRYAIRLAEA